MLDLAVSVNGLILSGFLLMTSEHGCICVKRNVGIVTQDANKIAGSAGVSALSIAFPSLDVLMQTVYKKIFP